MSTLALLIFPSVMAFAASSDLLTMRISNKLVLVLAASFFVIALAIGIPLDQIGLHILCALAVLAVSVVFFARGWMGGGDAKLAAATALWFGSGHTLPYLFYAAILGGGLTLAILFFRRLPLLPFIARHRWIERLHNAKSGVPYGIALAIAAMMIYTQTSIFGLLMA